MLYGGLPFWQHKSTPSARHNRALPNFNSEEAAVIEAIAAQVIPGDDAPGARKAHVIYFIDKILVTFDRDKQPVYTQGLKNLQNGTQELFPKCEQIFISSSWGRTT